MAKDIKKGIIYYTDNVPKDNFLKTFRTILKKSASGIPIVWVSQKPIPEKPNVVLCGIGRSYHSLCMQIVAGLKHIEADVIFFAEHDVIYHPSYYEFVPPKKDVFYYNINRWWLREKDGLASLKKAGSLSQLSAYKGIMEDFYIKRLSLYDEGTKLKRCKTEPGKFNVPELSGYKMERYESRLPNIDVRHDRNYTGSDRFKGKRFGYVHKDGIPGWGHTKGRYKEFIKEISNGSSRYD